MSLLALLYCDTTSYTDRRVLVYVHTVYSVLLTLLNGFPFLV